ncbi:hypothetical protein N431DRAFT_438225 [Stipitochalara longipes BDJ]|nr:hypothetical protein N431DRAFT_438225 [Stipitochalara longipes BDJ]
MASISTTRNSSPSRKFPTRRPKLMRASATAPSLATSNASRKDLALAGLQNSRAATLLTRVASYSSAQMGYGGGNGGGKRQSVGSFCESPVDSRSPESNSMGMERKEPFEIVISQCGNYFSFPSFEYFEDYQEQGERIDGRQEQDVP